MNTLYKITNLVRRYGGRVVLRLPELTVGRGEVVAVTGPNGSGKSTLLRTLAFLEPPEEGEVEFFGTPGVPPRQEACLLLQEPYLLKRSVFENIVFGLRVRGRRDKLEALAREALAEVDFAPDDMLRREWRELSGGEKQRVALAARLILRPLALLRDEPTSNVDAKSALAMQKAVAKAAHAGSTVIVASHDSAWLETLGARALRLE
ncbi:MAG: energy-coupling factor ABC transporter ATP-binding protein [Deltaproteobacteria bacterium]|jgi:tungstate transport system ATP-binding protein|nr:energy-coupling factor ABC transporter ATP-binding protein [Deltaproteobacteria bacterium]